MTMVEIEYVVIMWSLYHLHEIALISHMVSSLFLKSSYQMCVCDEKYGVTLSLIGKSLCTGVKNEISCKLKNYTVKSNLSCAIFC